MRGSGIRQSEFRQVDSFNEVNLSGFGTVNVFAGDSPSVRVTTDDNLLHRINTYVENGTLKIQPRGLINPKTGLQVDVTVSRLTAAHVSGAGDMNINDVVGNRLELTISGAGTIKANGHVEDISARISGAGDADLQNLIAKNANVRISGAGDAKVYAAESIKARISGAGDVTCFGSPPNVEQKVSGAGDFKIATASPPVNYSLSDGPD